MKLKTSFQLFGSSAPKLVVAALPVLVGADPDSGLSPRRRWW